MATETQKLRETLDRVFSVFIRLLYSDHAGYVTCYTCETRLPWQEAQCGHFIRRAHSAVRYDEDNCRPQCYECNMLKDGMEESFEEHLRDDLGNAAVDALVARGRTEYQYTEDQYKRLIQTYREANRRKGAIL